MAAEKRKINRRNKRPYFLLVWLLLLAGAGVIIYYAPAYQQVAWAEEPMLVIGDKDLGEGKVLPAEREIYLQVEPLKEYLDPHFHWDQEESTAVITTEDRLIHMKSEETEAQVNLEPLELEFPLQERDGELFLPLLFLSDYYQIEVEHHPESQTVVIDRPAKDTAYGGEVTSSQSRLRSQPRFRSPYLEILEAGDLLYLEEEEKVAEKEWVRVRTEQGVLGYLHRDDFTVADYYYSEEKRENQGTPSAEEDPEEAPVPSHPITMVWEFAYQPPDVDEIGDLGPTEVVSPTWFYLDDGEGNVGNRADPEYIEWARERDYQVWGLVSNDFDPEITAEMLESSSRRQNFINQLLAHARLLDLDGINVDFENFHYRYRDHFTQLVRELSSLAEAEGLVISVDVTMITLAEYYSLNYDREALAEAADYIALMAYDEHWDASPKPGSVASLPWVEEGLQEVLEEVPAEQLLLGVPFYTYRWEIDAEKEELEDLGEEEAYHPEHGEVEVTSEALSMEQIEQELEAREVEPQWDEEARQYYASYQEGGKTYKVWLEETTSMEQRLELVNHYDLAGVAAWRRGFEKPEIWEVFEEVLEDSNDAAD